MYPRWRTLWFVLFLVLTGAAQPAAVGPIDAAAFADEVEAAWERHDLRWWFPRVVDPAGGFFEQFDASGDGVPGGERTSIYQSRMTWTAAEIARRRPELREQFEPVARHGLRYLRRNLTPSNGGMWWGIDANRRPLKDGERHLYNISFGIYAGAAVERAMPGEGGLEFALDLFGFLEGRGRTDGRLGYFEHYARNGRAIRSPADPAAQGTTGTMAPEYGQTSMNAQIHLLEALAELHRATPENELVEERLRESYQIVSEALYSEPGYLHLYLDAEGEPIAGETSYGHNIETAYLLHEASAALGRGRRRLGKGGGAGRHLAGRRLGRRARRAERCGLP